MFTPNQCYLIYSTVVSSKKTVATKISLSGLFLELFRGGQKIADDCSIALKKYIELF